MNRCSKYKMMLTMLAAGMVLRAGPALACAACFGKSDSPLAKGMNWGIFALLVVIVSVLATVASFFVFLAKRAAAVHAEEALANQTQKA